MWHTVMQEKYMLEYVVYNIADVVLLQIMHWVTQDPIGMKVLTGNTSFANFNKQSKRALDVLYFKFLERGKVVGAGKPKDKEKTNDDDDDNVGLILRDGLVLLVVVAAELVKMREFGTKFSFKFGAVGQHKIEINVLCVVHAFHCK
jgi:hypothetical protein